MKNLFKFTFALCAFAVAVTATSCGDDDEGVSGTVVNVTFDNSNATAVLEAYAADVVVDRYATLAKASKSLYEAVEAVEDAIENDEYVVGTGATPTVGYSTATIANIKAKLSTAADAWKTARIAWERTEAYLFGPVDAYGIDPGIDSWPLDLADLAETIIEYADGDFSATDIQNDGGDLKGFHAIEFMLFADGAAKETINSWSTGYGTEYGFGDAAGAPTDAQLASYLVAITKELYRCTSLLVLAWDEDLSVANISSSDLLSGTDEGDLADEDGNASDGNYYATFTTAGQTGNSEYPNVSIALSTILEAAAGIADEVGSVKIADPIKSRSVLDVESWFSYNSVTDFTNNIVGIKEAYFGKQYADDMSVSAILVDETVDENSISAYIAAADSNLDLDVKLAIYTAIAKVNNMETPFRDNLTWTTENTAAAAACAALLEALETAQGAINDGFYIMY
ncbi:MAG: imelysin family protein [Rikenellaceae bacterium]